MKPVHQWSRDSCFAACIASILEIPKAPNFCHLPGRENWREVVNEWLAPLGLAYWDVTLPGDARDELVRFWGDHVISGNGPRGHRHSVVGHAGEIVFDPHPEGGGLIGSPEEWEYGLLIATHPTRQP